MKLILIIVLIYHVKLNYCDENCPYFNYIEDDSGRTVGQIEFENDFSGKYEMTVNVSVTPAADLNSKITLERISSSEDILYGGNLIYHLYFPKEIVSPTLILLEFNKKVYCTGLPERDYYIAYIWTTHKYDTKQPVRKRPDGKKLAAVI